jgi:hypothetical protein
VARLIRLDIINGNPRSFVAAANLEQGLFLEIKGKAQNVELGVVDYEAYAVELAKADTARGQLLLHASVANQYDERLSEVDFVLEKGRVGRGYQPVMGDIVTLPLVEGVAVGNKLALGANGLLVKSDNNAIAVVEALEDINIPEAEAQKSMVIRFL